MVLSQPPYPQNVLEAAPKGAPSPVPHFKDRLALKKGGMLHVKRKKRKITFNSSHLGEPTVSHVCTE